VAKDEWEESLKDAANLRRDREKELGRVTDEHHKVHFHAVSTLIYAIFTLVNADSRHLNTDLRHFNAVLTSFNRHSTGARDEQRPRDEYEVKKHPDFHTDFNTMFEAFQRHVLTPYWLSLPLPLPPSLAISLQERDSRS